jgi:hypothetical protein
VGAGAGNEQGAQKQDESAGGDGSKLTRQGLRLQIPVSCVARRKIRAKGVRAVGPTALIKAGITSGWTNSTGSASCNRGLMRMESFSQGR